MMNGNSSEVTTAVVNGDSNVEQPAKTENDQQTLKQELPQPQETVEQETVEQVSSEPPNDDIKQEPVKTEQENQDNKDVQQQQEEPAGEQNSTETPKQKQQDDKPENSQQDGKAKNANNERPDANCFLRCRGLPYSAGVDEVRKFFKDYNVADIIFTNGSDGRPTGECYVQFDSREQASRATGMDRQMMGKRYVEVFTVVDAEMEHLTKKLQMKKELSSKGYIRVRGLPYSCTKSDLEKFFQGLSVEEVVFGNTGTGPGLEKPKPSGEGMVKLGNPEQADKAMAQNGQHLGSRYLEIFKTDGVDYEGFKARAQGKIVSLKDLMQSDPWGPPPGFGGYGPPNWGGGYGGGYGPPGPGYGGGGGYGPPSYGSGYEQRGPGGPMSRGGYGADSNRYSPYGGGYGSGSGGGGGGRSGRDGGRDRRGRGRDNYDYDGGNGYNDGGYGGSGGYGGGGYGGGGGGYNDHLISPSKIYMQGLPFQVTAADIERFFAPLVCVDIVVGTTNQGRPNGDGLVEFQSPDQARQAMGKDRDYIGNRYIELIPSTSAKLPDHVRYDRIGGKGSSLGRGPPPSAQQYRQGPPYGGGGPPAAAPQQTPYGGGPPAQSQQYPPALPPAAASQSHPSSAPVYGGGATYQQQQTPGLPQSQPQQQSQQQSQQYGGQSQQYAGGYGGHYAAGGGGSTGGYSNAGYGVGAPAGGAGASGTDYSNYYSTYGTYGSGAGGYGGGGGAAGHEQIGIGQGMPPQQQPKSEYNWPTANF